MWEITSYLSSPYRGTDLHGPLIERMVELPMDIYEGRVNGEFRIKSHDYASWYFPEMFGMVGPNRYDNGFLMGCVILLFWMGGCCINLVSCIT